MTNTWDNHDTWRAYREFRSADPFLSRVLVAINRIADKDDPDRVPIRENSQPRTIQRLKKKMMEAKP